VAVTLTTGRVTQPRRRQRERTLAAATAQRYRLAFLWPIGKRRDVIIKPEVHNVSQRRQRWAKPQVTHTAVGSMWKDLVSIRPNWSMGHVVPENTSRYVASLRAGLTLMIHRPGRRR